MDLIKLKNPQIREKSYNTVTAYYGTASRLADELNENETRQRIRTFSQDTFNDVLYALRLISSIYDAAVVVHGPRGCGAAQLYYNHIGEADIKWSVTNLSEHDSIMGSDTKLREAIVSLYRSFKPRLIFVVATPVVAINNDDIQAVSEELQEELGISILPIYTDGFKSRTGLTGYDLVLHALSKHLINGDKKSESNFINIISVSESLTDLKEIEELVKQLGLDSNILPRCANRQNFANAPSAKLSVSINPDEGHVLGETIKEKYGIEHLHPGLPIGIEGTSRWIKTAGAAVGLENEAQALIERETAYFNTLAESYSFKAVKVYVNLPAAYAKGIAQFIEELGAEVVGITASHVDRLNKDKLDETRTIREEWKLHIAEGQSFEEANILMQLKPDVYIGGNEQCGTAARLGIPVIYIDDMGVLGFKGAYRLVRRLSKVLKNKNFVKSLSKTSVLPYQESWYQKRPDWFIKQEVK